MQVIELKHRKRLFSNDLRFRTRLVSRSLFSYWTESKETDRLRMIEFSSSKEIAMKQGTAPSREEVLQQALALDPADRAYVADELERSLTQTTFASEEIAAAWSEEIDRRIAACENGQSKAIDIDFALDRARQALLEHRSRRLTT
jgi:hypothetical protein